MALGKYLKSAFLNHWNLLAVAGGAVFGFLTGRPDIFLPIVAAGELTYLGLLGTHPKFQKYVEAQEAKEKRSVSEADAEAALDRITGGLPSEYLLRYEALRGRCLELRQIATDLRQAGPGGSRAPLEDMQLAGLDRLLWIYLRLLHTSWSLERFFERTSEEPIRADIERLEKRVAEIEAEKESMRRKKALVALRDNLETSRTRMGNLEKARENHELIQLELDRLENKIRTLSEIAVNRQEPDFISDQVDAVASSMLSTERTMNELQFATGLAAGEQAVPELISRAPGAEEVEFVELPEDEEPPPRRSRRGPFRRRRRETER